MIKKSKIQSPKFCHLSFVLWISFVICALSFVICFNNSYAQAVSSTDLIKAAKQYDGTTVVYHGEVIGDIMVRGDYVWLNVKDNNNAIGVWAPTSLVKDINYAGNYKIKGDLIEVEGVFNNSCRQHGGDLDIHAESIIKIKKGCEIYEKLDSKKARLAAVCGIILILAVILKILARKHLF